MIAYSDNNYTRTFGGNLNYANQTVVLNATNGSGSEGWNMVGNPFPASIAINNSADATNNFLSDNAAVLNDSYEAVYLWNSNDYLTINQASDATFLNSAQGFFINADSNGDELQINTSIQKHEATTFYKSQNDISRFSIGVTGPTNDYNNTTIAFIEGKTKGLDPGFDAQKLKANQNISLYSILADNDGFDYAIQTLPLFDNQIVKIGLDAWQPGVYEFSDFLMENIANQTIFLEDITENIFVNLSTNTSYSFSVSVANIYKDRFVLHFGNIVTAINHFDSQENSITIFSDRQNIVLQNIGNENTEGIFEIYNLAGQILDTKNIFIDSNSNVSINSEYKAGMYFVCFRSNQKKYTQKIILGQK